MKVEIWSDVACPFCWLGKRRFEGALADFEHRGEVEVEWKSFQLNPGLETDPDVTLEDYLADAKGIEPASARAMNDRIAQAGQAEGILYRFDRVVVANTRDAHRLIQLAKAQGIQDDAEERLFRAYFEEGKNVADRATLIELGAEIGLEREAVANMLESGGWAGEVMADVQEARELGINGVPFFVLDRKYGVSGAQDSDVFLAALEQAFAERGADG